MTDQVEVLTLLTESEAVQHTLQMVGTQSGVEPAAPLRRQLLPVPVFRIWTRNDVEMMDLGLFASSTRGVSDGPMDEQIVVSTHGDQREQLRGQERTELPNVDVRRATTRWKQHSP